jgi:hypothetical protein
VNFNSATTTSAVLSVYASNGCGNSPVRSKTITVNLNCKLEADVPVAESQQLSFSSLSLYPNPTSGKAMIEFDATKDCRYKLIVYDFTGRILINEDLVAVEGLNSKEINLENVAKGIYMVSVRAGERAQTLRLIVE